MKIVLSLLNAPRNFIKMKAQLAPLVKNKLIDKVHVDVMDGEFVDNYTLDWLNAELVAKLHKAFPKLFIEIHLMVHFPSNYFEKFAKAGANRIWIHVESVDDGKKLNDGLNKYKKVEFGPVLNPETPLSTLQGNLRRILIMSVHPGKGGQKLIPATLTKVKQLRERFPLMTISVDGGVDMKNISRVKKAGANETVCGTVVFKGNPEKNMQKLLRNFSFAERTKKALSRYERGLFKEMKKEDFLRKFKKW